MHKKKGKGDSECRKVRREGGQRVQKSKKGRRAASAQKEGKGGSECRKVRREVGQRVQIKKGKGDSECRKVRREGRQRVHKKEKGKGQRGQRLHKKLPPLAADPRCSSATLQLHPALAAHRCCRDPLLLRPVACRG